jgi:hypothetical protein
MSALASMEYVANPRANHDGREINVGNDALHAERPALIAREVWIV